MTLRVCAQRDHSGTLRNPMESKGACPDGSLCMQSGRHRMREIGITGGSWTGNSQIDSDMSLGRKNISMNSGPVAVGPFENKHALRQ